jgi:hypothetical protein
MAYFPCAGCAYSIYIANIAYRLNNTGNKDTTMYYWQELKGKKTSNTKENQKMNAEMNAENEMWLKLADSEEIGFFLTYDERNCYMNADSIKGCNSCL